MGIEKIKVTFYVIKCRFKVVMIIVLILSGQGYLGYYYTMATVMTNMTMLTIH